MSKSTLLSKALTRQSQLSKDELKEVLHVAKQLFGLIFGIILGLIPVIGLPGILAFVVAKYLFFYGYVFRFLQLDEDTIETSSVFSQSFMLSFMCFILSWVLTYTFCLK